MSLKPYDLSQLSKLKVKIVKYDFNQIERWTESVLNTCDFVHALHLITEEFRLIKPEEVPVPVSSYNNIVDLMGSRNDGGSHPHHQMRTTPRGTSNYVHIPPASTGPGNSHNVNFQ